MNAYLVVIFAGIGSYALRAGMLVTPRREVSALFEHAARFAVPTAFAALVVGSLATRPLDHTALAPAIAIAAGVIAARRTGAPQAALVAGMPVLWLVSAVAGR